MAMISMMTMDMKTELKHVHEAIQGFEKEIRAEIKQETQGMRDKEGLGGDEGDEQVPVGKGGSGISK